MLSVFVTQAPAGARLAIARPDDPADRAIVVIEHGATVPSLPMPGLSGIYELRLTVSREGRPVVIARQPLQATEPEATLSAPARVGRRQALPLRGIGPNGVEDRVVLAQPGDPPDTLGAGHFFPAENVEATLEAPEQPGEYELRYVMRAPLVGDLVLARRPLTVD